MVATEFLDYVNKFQVLTYVGVEDLADKFSFLYSTMILVICATLISIKQYVLSAIKCYSQQAPGGSGYNEYMESYCWVHGTYRLRITDSIQLKNETMWKHLEETRIQYYQWVPFVLGLQCIMFYLPRVVWQLFIYNNTGTDLNALIITANAAVKEHPEVRAKTVNHVALAMRDIFFNSRQIRTNRRQACLAFLANYTPIMCFSKRSGAWMFSVYFLIKVAYFANCVCQLYLMKRFLGFGVAHFGAKILSHVVTKDDWRETMIFPRVTFCRIDMRHIGNNVNKFLAQCVLSVNMINEKVYIFLWIWCVLVSFITALSLVVWLFRMVRLTAQVEFVTRYFRLKEVEVNTKQAERFIKNFLRKDGVFVLEMFKLNVGDMMCGDIVLQLYEMYTQEYYHKDFRVCIAAPSKPKDITESATMVKDAVLV